MTCRPYTLTMGMVLLAFTLPTQSQAKNLKICDDKENICVIYIADEKDSDRDGVPDEDEAAAGSDVKSADSIPDAKIMLDLLRKRQLPSFESIQSIVALMPQPPVRSSKQIPGVSAAARIRGRIGLLDSFGIDMSSLGRVGIDGLDMTNGLAMANSFGGKSQVPSIGGIALGNMSLYAAGETTGLVVDATTATNAGPNGGKSAQSVEGTPGGMNTTFDDGSHDEYSKSSQGGTTTETNTSYNSNGQVTGQSVNSGYAQDGPEPGQTTYTQTSSNAVTNENGSTTVTNTTTTTVVDNNSLDVKKETKETNTTTTNQDGSSTTTTTTETTTYPEGKPKETKTESKTKNCDSAGNCTEKPAESSGGYMDPDNTNVVYVTDKLLRQIAGVKKGSNTTPANTGDSTEVDRSFFTRPSSFDIIALYDPDSASGKVTVMVAPNIWNSSKGTIRTVEGIDGTPKGDHGTYDVPSNFENIMHAVGDISAGRCVSGC